MNRRGFLASGVALCAARPAFAQHLNFSEAAAYSAQRRGVSFLVMRGGEIVFEDYPGEGARESAWELASGTKSFASVMVAAAVQDGLISSWDETCAETLTEWRGDERRAITLRHLLSLTSGIGGGTIGAPPTYADAIMARAEAAPGVRFAYGPTPYQIFGEIMRRKTNGDPVAYLQRRVLDPIAVTPATWQRGADGASILSTGAQLTARQWARFGVFVLRGGEGRIDGDALSACFQPSAANPGYGLTWWLLRTGRIVAQGAPPLEVDPALLDATGPVHTAAGAGNQRLYVLPRHDMLVVRQATGILESLRNPAANDWSDIAFLRTLFRV